MFSRFAIVVIPVVLATTTLHAKVGFRQVTSTHPVAIQRGTAVEVKLRSNFTLDETYAVFFSRPGIKMTFAETEPVEAPRSGRGSIGTPFRFQVEVPDGQMTGVYEYRVATKQSVSSCAQLMVTDYPVAIEEEKENGTADKAQAVELPVAMCGVCEKFEDVDCYQFSGKAGQRLTFQIFAQRVTDRLHSMVVKGPRIYLMDPILTLFGPNGQVVAQNDNFFGGDSFIHCALPVDGQYTLEVRDARYAGNARYVYCVEMAESPFAYSLFPMAVQQGTQTDVEVVGEALGDTMSTKIEAATDDLSELGWRTRRVETPNGLTNPVPLKISRHPQFIETEDNNTLAKANQISFPVGINGRLSEVDDIDFYRFEAKKDQQYHFEVESHRHGMPLDSIIELYNAEGKLLTDADDIGGNHKTKDARLLWKCPADGEYAISIRDLHGRGGLRFVYHLRADLAEPDFELFGEYYYAQIAPGTRMIWFAKIERLSGFDGPVAIEVDGLPPGVTQTPVTIPKGMKHCGIILSAAEDAEINASLVKVVGRAAIEDSNGKEVEIVRRGHITCEQQSSGGGQARWPIETQIVGVTKPLDLVRVTATPEVVMLKPGESVEIDVKIERVEGFKDAVTLAMSFDYFSNKFGEQLPPGVVMSGKSKARLSGDNLKGKIVLEATDKAVPVEMLPIAALARVSITFSITTNYASNPVYLSVEPKEPAK